MQYTIKNELLSVTVDDFGAQLVSVKYQGKERLWQNETGEWDDHSPLLFPVCGHFGIKVNGKQYPMKAHGFAKKAAFALKEKTENSLTFTISANEETKKFYPYDFVLDMVYQIEGNKLIASYTVKNPANEPLYFACGGHDSFATDSGDMSNYQVIFESEEHFLHLYHDDDGYLTGETRDFGTGKALVLPQDFLQEGATLIFKNLNGNKVTLSRVSGEKLAALTFEGYPNLLLWREDNAKFICIEPWTNLPDYAGVEDIEFAQKEGVLKVDGGQTKTLTRTVEYF